MICKLCKNCILSHDKASCDKTLHIGPKTKSEFITTTHLVFGRNHNNYRPTWTYSNWFTWDSSMPTLLPPPTCSNLFTPPAPDCSNLFWNLGTKTCSNLFTMKPTHLSASGWFAFDCKAFWLIDEISVQVCSTCDSDRLQST